MNAFLNHYRRHHLRYSTGGAFFPGIQESLATEGPWEAEARAAGAAVENGGRYGGNLSTVTGGRQNAAAPAFFSAGRPLPPSEKHFFGAAFGRDLSAVRIHDDAPAQRSADALQARAYTLGNDIFLGKDSYRPASPAGRRLLGHEIAHTIQQRSGQKVIQKEEKPGAPPQYAPTPEIDFKVLPPEFQLRLFSFLLKADTSKAALDFQTRSLTAGLGYEYGSALSLSLKYRDFTTKLGWKPDDNIFTLGAGYRGVNLNLSAQPEATKYSLGLSYGAPLLPSFGSMSSTFTGGQHAAGNILTGLPGALNDPLAFYEAHKQDVEDITKTVDLVKKITDEGKQKIRFGAAFSLSYDPESRLVVSFSAGARF